ncbi:hypothetical protein [Paenibacillus oleatilyticus]|nr:hypothetical protein [Paenibacillus oleatilyticus]
MKLSQLLLRRAFRNPYRCGGFSGGDIDLGFQFAQNDLLSVDIA